MNTTDAPAGAAVTNDPAADVDAEPAAAAWRCMWPECPELGPPLVGRTVWSAQWLQDSPGGLRQRCALDFCSAACLKAWVGSGRCGDWFSCLDRPHPVTLVTGSYAVRVEYPDSSLGPVTTAAAGANTTGGISTTVPVGAIAVAVAVPREPEYATVASAADAALTYAATRKPEQPLWFQVHILPQPRPTTSDTVEAAIRAANARRATPLNLRGLAVGLVSWEREGSVYLIEGICP